METKQLILVILTVLATAAVSYSTWQSSVASPKLATRLTDEQQAALRHYVTRQKGTEPPFSGQYWDTKKPGIYRCVHCNAPLFSSEAKYDSGTGWPSFREPIGEMNLEERSDGSLLMSRTEVVCRQCESHLGHVFPDGPPPTGLRYCINSVSLRLDEDPASAHSRP